MKIGLAKAIMTPVFPVKLAGYAVQRVAKEKYDDLYVKISMFEIDDQMYGYIAYDLIAVDELIVTQVHKILTALNMIPAHFILTATHTHAGPGGVLNCTNGLLRGADTIFMPTDQTYIKHVIAKTKIALQEAVEDLEIGSVSVSRGTLSNIGSNRNDRAFAGNDELFVVYLKQQYGKQAVIVNFACHPTVLSCDNHILSADFPGVLDRQLQDAGYYYCMFLNGSCGDISTRFTRQTSGYEEVIRYGTSLAQKVLALQDEKQGVEIKHIHIQVLNETLLLKKAEPIADAQRKFEDAQKAVYEAKQKQLTGGALRTIESYLEGAAINLRYATNAITEDSYNVSITIIQVEEDIFVHIPGEMFSELSNTMQHKHVHFICYANGYLGYFPDEYAYEQHYYEAMSSPFEKGEATRLLDQVRESIKQMVKASSAYL